MRSEVRSGQSPESRGFHPRREVGGRLLEALLRAESDVGQPSGTVEFERGALFVGDRAFRLGVGRGDLGGGLVDRRVLRLDLPAEARDRRVLGGDLAFGGVDREAIVAVVDARQQVPGVNLLVFGDRDFDDVAGDLGGDDGGVSADIGVVGRDEEAPLDEPIVAPIDAVAERGQGDERQDEAPRRPRAAGGGGRSASGRWFGCVAAQSCDLSRFAHRREHDGRLRLVVFHHHHAAVLVEDEIILNVGRMGVGERHGDLRRRCVRGDGFLSQLFVML